MDLFTHLSVFLVESATWFVISEERAGLWHEHGEAKETQQYATMRQILSLRT